MNTPPEFPAEPPVLDPNVLDDEQALSEWADAVVLADEESRERMHEIFRYTEALRAILDEHAWRLFMRYDELSNARAAELFLVLTRAASGAGQRHPRSTEEMSS